jgi:hypothetical protein
MMLEKKRSDLPSQKAKSAFRGSWRDNVELTYNVSSQKAHLGSRQWASEKRNCAFVFALSGSSVG